ncbi:MAG TPA: ATP-binding protein [Candidatus Limnocylindrales bacterium]|nr:ATP-binding protein [Candidatus Limnocylindrales bacterium]
MDIKTLYENILSSLRDGIIVIDINKKITLFNQAAEHLLDLPASQACGKNFDDLPAMDSEIRLLIRDTLLTGKTFSSHKRSLFLKNGKTLSLDIATSPLFNQQGDIYGVVIVLRDLTAIKDLEEEIRRKDILASMGSVAAGIAHEIKNPLGSIIGASQLLYEEVKNNPELAEYLKVVIKEAERVNRLIEDLLSLTKPTRLNFKKVNIHEILKNILLLESASSTKIIFQEEYDPSLPEILADREKLTQVFLNLIHNGIEAMSGQGIIKLVTRVSTDCYISRTGPEKRSRPMIVVEIHDQGEGIPEDAIEKLFTPFYTTKPKGVGLGLAISHKIIEEHEGFIKVESKIGKGSIFKVYLPLS